MILSDLQHGCLAAHEHAREHARARAIVHAQARSQSRTGAGSDLR